MTRVEFILPRFSSGAAASRGPGVAARTGESIVAQVVEASPDGHVILNAGGRYIPAITEVPLAKGMTLHLLVAHQDLSKEVRLKLVGLLDMPGVQDGATRYDALIHDMIRGLSGGKRDDLSRLAPALLKALGTERTPLSHELLGDIRTALRGVLKSGDEWVSARLLRLSAPLVEEGGAKGGIGGPLRYGAPRVEDLTGSVVRDALLDSGTVLEAKLRRAVLLSRDDTPGTIALDIGQDVKAQLLRMRERVGEGRGTAPAGSRDSAAALVEQTLRDIEVFQALSKATGSWSTFLPLTWEGLREGGISLRAGQSDRGDRVFTCRIDLDLRDAGRITASLVMRGSDLFVTFSGGSPEFRRLVTEHREELDRTLAEGGLTLRAVNLVEQHEQPEHGPGKTESAERLVSVKA